MSLVRPLACAVAELGETAFRTITPPPHVWVFERIPGRGASRLRSWHLVASSDVDAIATFLNEDWSQGDQVALIGAASDERACRLLAADRLDRFSLVAAELMVAALVDGAGMLVCASDEEALERAIEKIGACLIEAGMTFETAD